MKISGVAGALADASLDGVLAFDLEQRYVLWNAAMEHMTGMRAADVLGRRAPDTFSFLIQGGEVFLHERALRGETVTSPERAFSVPETGKHGWIDCRYLPLRDESGAVIGALGVIRDVTQNKRAAAHLAETEQLFQNMADASPVLLWMAGVDSLCTFFNQTWLTFTGRTLEEEWGIGWAEGLHFEDLPRALDTYEAAFNARLPFEMEYRLRRADGVYRWILDRGAPRYEPNGAFAGYIGSCLDITDRRELETELREKVRLRDDFLSIASHELRTPLNSLRLNVEGMARDLARGADVLSEDRSLRLVSVQRSVERVNQLITRLLDASRMRSGIPGTEQKEFDLAEAVRDACERMRGEIQRAGSSLDVSTVPMVGLWDKERIDLVVMNLLSNAAKYGAGKPISVRVEGDTTTARVVVRDEGIGVSPEDQERIFMRFERAVPSRSFGGFGLGLWIANEIATASGGRIDVDSSLGAGAAFTVTLPRAAHVDSVGGGLALR